ncbi:similar to Saccharomyces cerevisiae YIL044C AGE2 ADP-ribosylation factor (ARF) GTPase activating protein (GAP) effector, involved in Trans-Golgi-Network (TGN) transport [Maudiozyma saulgeensis]|uniref:Similar to Saccharomyces cerevisiae YIL044C AGE2 ADP-ribosylation factor (ARF) GTPase activating protein (GAP) effector, involved in Trans-Golgi-Network (TGN) transport n=1 Tax=Maudiozyma saulgeensis TaxID=1789683 RepID=A0A1X7QY64_9SACH|nr:similar to Saccharomyces cerevisiae YIL044C AGE2 ADP-ribosylation factor (ARF) GTPase activating protein (GAP) effector, involved in Trans-Golgi-Network (TGN) transport [Kazachstania saulgeensis]
MSTSIPVKKALGALLRDPGNSICADCKSQSHPRWASWSLGVFICIRCAGVHRSLGTHVSKVKSVDLDTWKEEHLKELIRMQNNINANLYYECRLNDDIKDNLKQSLLDTNKLQTFIRAKYEAKKWIGEHIPNKKDLSLPKKENLLDDSSHSNSNALLNVNSPNDLLSDSMNQLNINNTNNTNNNRNNSNNLTKFSGNSNNNSLVNLEKLSSSISNGSASNITSNNNNNNNNNNNSTSSNNSINTNSKLNQRPDLKKSILSLYSKSNTNVRTPTNNTNTNMSLSSLTSSTTKLQNTSNNNSNISTTWSSTLNNSNSTSNNNSALSLDDNELFKNVWS